MTLRLDKYFLDFYCDQGNETFDPEKQSKLANDFAQFGFSTVLDILDI